MEFRARDSFDSGLVDIYIPYIYCITLNDNHTKLNDKIQDNDLNFELTDKGNHLLLTSRPPRTKVKPNLLQNFLTKYNPLNFVNHTLFRNDEANVTHCKKIVKTPILKSKKILKEKK